MKLFLFGDDMTLYVENDFQDVENSHKSFEQVFF